MQLQFTFSSIDSLIMISVSCMERRRSGTTRRLSSCHTEQEQLDSSTEGGKHEHTRLSAIPFTLLLDGFFSLEFGAPYCQVQRQRTDLSYLHRTALGVAISLVTCFSSFIHGMFTSTKSIKSARAKTEVKMLGLKKKKKKE